MRPTLVLSNHNSTHINSNQNTHGLESSRHNIYGNSNNTGYSRTGVGNFHGQGYSAGQYNMGQHQNNNNNNNNNHNHNINNNNTQHISQYSQLQYYANSNSNTSNNNNPYNTNSNSNNSNMNNLA